MKKFLKYIFNFNHLGVCAVTFAMLWLLKTLTFSLDILNPVADAMENFSAADIFFEIQHSGSEPEISDIITIVDMTELHDRGDIAMLFEEINMNDPLLVGVDLIFEGVKDNHLGNELLEGATMGLSDKTIFSTKLIEYNGEQEEFTGKVQSYFANDLGITEAYTNLKNDMTGALVREFSTKQTYNGEEMLSFPAKLAATFDESLYSRGNEDLLINYRNVEFPVVKWDEIAQKSDLIEGHIVLVGTMTEEQDMHMTPLGKMPGLKVQAFSLLTLLEHKDIRKIPLWLTLVIAFIACYILELCFFASNRYIDNHPKSAFLTFAKESELTKLAMQFIFILVTCWISFMLFINNNILLESNVIMALLILLFEGDKVYYAIICAIARKRESKEKIN